MKKVFLLMVALGMTFSLSSCFGPELLADYDPYYGGPEIVVVHDGPHHPVPAPHHHYSGRGYHW